MPDIHSTAIVHPSVVLGEGTREGAYSIIDEGVQIGKNCDIETGLIFHNCKDQDL